MCQNLLYATVASLRYLLHAPTYNYMQPNNIPISIRAETSGGLRFSENKRAKFQKRSTEAGSELVGESKATLVGESKARSMSPAATRPDTKRAEVCGLPSGRRRCVEVPWRGDALSQPSAMALRTMAPLTTALLTTALLAMAVIPLASREQAAARAALAAPGPSAAHLHGPPRHLGRRVHPVRRRRPHGGAAPPGAPLQREAPPAAAG